MKIIFSFGFLLIALSMCSMVGKVREKLTGDSAVSNSNTAGSDTTGKSSKTTGAGGDEKVETPELTAAQQAIADGGETVNWSDQGIEWKLPKGWKKMSQSKDSFNYSSPDLAFLLANISVMPDNFPSDSSLTATYDSALQQIKNGKYESARYLEIDGVKGVEFVETMPEDRSGPRRFQWIAFRNYLGQNQQLNIMLSTKGSNFDKHRDDFAAAMYSMKIQK